MSGPTRPGSVRARSADSNGAPPVPGSLLAKLRDAAGRQREKRHIELDVPGAFAGMMRVRYHGLPLDGLERYSELLTDRASTTNLSTVLGHALHVLRGGARPRRRRGPVGGARPTSMARSGSTTGSRACWASRARRQVELTPREVVEALFMPGGNSVPLGNHAGELATWLSDAEGTEPGESSAATGSSSSAGPPPSE